MTTKAVIFDLDETLMYEASADEAAFVKTCALAVERFGIDAERLYEAIGREAEALWRESGYYEYLDGLGAASWEALWCGFEGDHKHFAPMREWVGPYRLEAWQRALAAVGVEDLAFAAEIAAMFVENRRAEQKVFPHTHDLLKQLQGNYRLALLTNGIPDIQWIKIRAIGVEEYFDVIAISGELEVGKPDPQVFAIVCEKLGVSADETVMIGNSLGRDIQGAKNAGIRSIWIKTDDCEKDRPVEVTADHEIESLTEIPLLL